MPHPTHRILPALLAGLLTGAGSRDEPAAEEATPGESGASDETVRSLLQQSLDAFRATAGFPGGALACCRGATPPAVVTSGVRDRRTGEAVLPDDRFLAGSIGKTFLSATVLRKQEDGDLDLDEPIADWLGGRPWFGGIAGGPDLTFRMLLQHTSGLPDHLADPACLAGFRKDPEKVWTSEELARLLVGLPARFEPGSSWGYSDSNYLLLGHALEVLTERKYEDLVAELFLIPLALEGILPQGLIVPRIVTGHCQTGRVLGYPEYVIEDGRFVINPQLEWTGGGMATTAGDLCRWTRLLFGGHLHRAETMEQMLAGHAASTGPDQEYGLGVQLRESTGGPVRYHGGWFPGYMSETAYYPELDLALTVQVNSDHHTRPSTFQPFLDELATKLAKLP